VSPQWVGPLTEALADPDLPLMRFYLYSVKKGDTLSEIALWYGVSIPMIQRYNPGLSPERLKIAQNLVIPGIKDVGTFRKGTKVGG
jgi:LysM repeat protein